MPKRSRLKKMREPLGKTSSDLALEFKIIQEQLQSSKGKVRSELIKQRDAVVKKYKKLVK